MGDTKVVLRVTGQHWITTVGKRTVRSGCKANENKDFTPTMDEIWEQMYAKLKYPVFLGPLISKLLKHNYRGDSTHV